MRGIGKNYEKLYICEKVVNMDIETRAARCRELKKSYNCAQAVALGFADMTDLPAETLERCTAGYGLGMGNMEGTCGALTGACMICGLLSADRNEARKRMISIMKAFKERNGATTCRELKGVDTGRVLRECPDCVADAAEFLALELKS